MIIISMLILSIAHPIYVLGLSKVLLKYLEAATHAAVIYVYTGISYSTKIIFRSSLVRYIIIYANSLAPRCII